MPYVEWDEVVTTIDNSSTDSEIPTAKAVNDIVTNINTVLSDMVTPTGATPTTADYLSQLDDDRDDLADNLVTMGVVASQSETITDLVPKVLQISGGGTDWGDTITDDWDTIIANANAGTVSGYSIGQTKTMEFVYNSIPLAIQCMLIGKSHDTISGTANKAALSFMFKYAILHYQMNTTATNAGGYMGENGDVYANSLDVSGDDLIHGCPMRKFLWTLYNAFPSNIKTAIKTVDKKYDDSNGLQTAKEKLFLPCVEETGTTYANSVSGQGTGYSYFSSADDRKFGGIGTNLCVLRSRRTDNQQFTGIIRSAGTASAGAANTFYGIIPIFCL